ncbi:terminase large subunit domain-containing protein [Taylorella asinigenitalis]|nr:terminase family protein [Taylorella asinigenitalis]
MNEKEALLKFAKDDLITYSCLVDSTYTPNRFHEFLASRLQAAIERGKGRIMIFAPPQHGKSYLVSKLFIAWALGKIPDLKVISASYGDDLVQQNGQAVRNFVSGPIHQSIFGNRIEQSTRAKDYFLTNTGGQYLGVTIRGGGTGFPSRLFVIDDPFKSRAEAESEAFRNHVKDWYRSVCYTRLAEDSILVIMHTRWHADDLAGWLLSEHKHENWELISLPAIAESDDIMSRLEGEALVPERFSVESLNQKRLTVGSRDWVSLYQQRPIEAGGNIFKQEWLRFYDEAYMRKSAMAMNRYIIVDPARTQKKESDYTAMVVIGLNLDGNYYLLDAVYDRLTLKQRAETLIDLHRKWMPLQVGYKKTGHEQDIEYISEAQNRQNYRFAVIPLSEHGAKNARIERLAPDFENSKWWLPSTMWKTNSEGIAKDLIEQLINEEYKAFPAGRHDDFLDCISGIKDMNTRFPMLNTITRPKSKFFYA